MKTSTLIISLILFVFANGAFAQTGVTTLYANDALSQSLCFADGKYGSTLENKVLKNRCSNLFFHSYAQNAFSVGKEGGWKGSIVDIGKMADLKTKYGYQETVGQGQGFASLNVLGGKVQILKDYQKQTVQELAEAAPLASFTKTNDQAAVQSGHVYLIKLMDGEDAKSTIYAKLLVVAYTPGESVTFRWSLMNNE